MADMFDSNGLMGSLLFGKQGAGLGTTGQEYGQLLTSGDYAWGQAEEMRPDTINAAIGTDSKLYNDNTFSPEGTTGLMGTGGEFDWNSMMKGGLGLLQGYGMLNSILNSNKYMGLLEEQVAMTRERWDMTKQEINDIKQTRSSLQAKYG